jgi:hypothetical protein
MKVKECYHNYLVLGDVHRCCLPTGDDHPVHRCIPECGAEWTDESVLVRKGTGRGWSVRWNELTLEQREQLYPGYLKRLYQQETLDDKTYDADAVSRDGISFIERVSESGSSL